MTKAKAAPTVKKIRAPKPTTPTSPLNADEIAKMTPTHARNTTPLTPPRQVARGMMMPSGTDVQGATVNAPRRVRPVDHTVVSHNALKSASPAMVLRLLSRGASPPLA